MTQTPGQPTREIAELRSNVRQLRETIRVLEDERDEVISRRFRRLLFFGVGLSLLCHIGLMLYLNSVGRGGGQGFGDGSGVGYTVAVLNDEELTGDEEMSFDELPAGPAENDSAAPEDVSLETTSPDAGIATAAPGTVPTLGASGEGAGGISGTGDGSGGGGDNGLGLGGGGGYASFFGVGGKGQRFAFIVDISGSMSNDRKFEIAIGELARSIEALPDFAQFHVILFESKTIQPPVQTGWLRARKTTVRSVKRWLGEVEPSGGTEPRNAFLQVFSLENRPDVIFFLTDGMFNDITAEELAALNARGKKAVINTIGFGAPGEVDQTVLRAMAAASGGQYRFVSTEAANP